MKNVITLKILAAFYLMAASLTVIRIECSTSLEELEDFPLDDTDSTHNNGNHKTNSANQFHKESDDLENGHLKSQEDKKREIMKRVVSAAMLKPGARQRLAQVMPILRTMSGPQRLALAALVSAQVMASPESPALPSVDPSQNVTSELMLPISMDIASMFRGLGREDMARSADYRSHLDINSRGRPPHFTKPNSFGPPSLRDIQIGLPTEILSPPPLPTKTLSNTAKAQKPRHPLSNTPLPPPSRRQNNAEPTVQECQFFSQSLCLEDTNYPQNEILVSMKKSVNRDSYNSLLIDSNQDLKEIDPFGEHVERRQGDGNSGENRMCPTKVEMARPKRARATSGAWKYIVNTGEYIQTLRLELCLRPQSSCTYLQEGLKSECLQVYNYHRLLTWDQHSGLMMDVFKVPTCCSCHVQGLIPGRQHMPAVFLEGSPESNFISPETTQRLPQKPGMRLRVETGHSIPKRESASTISTGSSRRPSLNIIHRGPPLPIQHEQDIPPRYPPYHNNLRRTSYRNHTLQSETPSQTHQQSSSSNGINSNSNRFDSRPIKVHLEGQPIITPNQRHPELPIDNILLSGTSRTEQPLSAPITPAIPTTTPSRRINYSYHPIIDFFKTATSSSGLDQRMDKADWTPITEGPRHANNNQ